MNVYLAEFLGTAILILFGGGVCANVNLKRSAANGADWIVITAGWGLAVTMGVYAVGQFSGAHLNPAVSLALALDGSFDWSLVPGYIVAQMLGAIVGATIVWLMYLPHWKATEEAGAKLGVFSTAPAIKNYFANFLSEIIGTMAGYAINPARDLGPRIAHAILPIAGKGGSNWSYAIVPILGPIAGGLLGAVVYAVFYKHTFNIGCAIAIVVVIITLILGYILNKSSKKGDIESIY